MAGERTEQATPQRRDKARREGDILHSRELCAAAGTLGGVMLLRFAAARFLPLWHQCVSDSLALGQTRDWEPAVVDKTMRALLLVGLHALAPVSFVAGSVMLTALAFGIMQTGGLQFHPQVVSFRLDRLNPLGNIKNLFSLRSSARLGKSMMPAALLAVFAAQRIDRQKDLPPFSTVRIVTLGDDVYQILMAASWLLFSWALVDYLVEWRSRETRLKMSRQEMRDEYKESEGNPQIRGRIRNLQRQSRHRRLQSDVSKAAVVITNPTHYAVALAFDFATMEAPKVLAKGRNLLAEEIKEQARWAGVPILENPPLARSLYRAVEVGDSIPIALYAAVASILAFLYRQRVQEEIRARQGRQAPSTPAAAGQSPAESNPPAAVIPGHFRGARHSSPGRKHKGRGVGSEGDIHEDVSPHDRQQVANEGSPASPPEREPAKPSVLGKKESM